MNEIEEFTPPHPLRTPVLFLVFNRPDTTQIVFDEIRKAQPAQLFVAADGPRNNQSTDYKLCNNTRDIIQQVDWDCKIFTRFQEENLGCKRAVSSAIDWFFSNVEEGIILEDDCVPNQSFFWFCEELLERYRDDLRVGQISGSNYGYKNEDLKYDYFFSKYPQIWGWATWKSRWCKYDIEMSKFDEIITNGQLEHIFMKSEFHKRVEIFQKTKKGLIDTWDYQWSLNLYLNRQYSLIPKFNLIKNIGFDRNDAVHTKGKNHYNNTTFDIPLVPKNHPQYILELQTYYDHINKKSFISKIKSVFI